MFKIWLKEILSTFCITLVIVLGLQRLASIAFSYPMLIAVSYVAVCWPAFRLLVSIEQLTCIPHIKTSMLAKTLSAIGYVAIVVAAFITLALLFPDERDISIISDNVGISLIVSGILVLYSFAVCMLHWTRFRVPDEKIVLLNGKIKYPESRFFWHPSMHVSIKLVRGKIELNPFDLQIKCQDQLTIDCSIQTAVRLDIASATTQKAVITYDPATAQSDIEKDLTALLQKKAADSTTFADFIMADKASGQLFGGFPYIWKPCDTQITIKMKSLVK